MDEPFIDPKEMISLYWGLSNFYDEDRLTFYYEVSLLE